MRRIIFCLLAIFLLASCGKTTVNLNVKNPTEISQIPRIIVLSNTGIEKETIYLGKLEPQMGTTATIKVKPSSNVVVKSSIEKGYDAWESGKYTIPRMQDEFSINVNLGFEGEVMVDDSGSIEQIKNILLNLGEYVGFKPISVRNALSTWFGSLVVIIPPSNGNSVKILVHIQPGQFNNIVTTYNQFDYPPTQSYKEVKVIGKSSAQLAAEVPVYGSIGVDFNKDNLYNVRWSMNGFGTVEKQDPANWSLLNALESLPNNQKAYIQTAMEDNPNSIMLYVNQIYVLKNADFFIKESRKLESGAKISVQTFVTADGAWTFDSVNEAHQQFQELVLNVGGITVPASILKETVPASTGAAPESVEGAAGGPRGAGGVGATYLPTSTVNKYKVVRHPEIAQKKYLLSGDLPQINH